jgi:hypothetical protein
MRQMFRMGLPTVLMLLLLINASSTFAQTSTFTYQGRLTDGGTPANGPYDFQFTLWDALSGGNQVPDGTPASTLARDDVMVGNGIFSVQLDFGVGSFPGADRFLQISVRQGASTGSFTPLTPRQQLTSTPYAIRANSAASADSAMTAANNVLKAGDTMTGELVLSGNPTTNLGAATKQYVDGSVASKLSLSGGTMSGVLDLASNKITSLATPTVGTDAANKAYVDSVASGGSGVFPWEVVSGTSQQALSNHGYIASNASEVTITLPASPNIGDIVRVSGAGAGGWRIAQNPGQRILLESLYLGPKLWQAVASSANGTRLVAVADLGQIYTSTDSGLSWTPRDSDRNWRSVASSVDGSKLVAVVASGQIYTSIDGGFSWTPRDSNRTWRSVASSADGSKLVAVVAGGQIYTSIDSGVTWTPRDTNRDWVSIASSADGNKLAAVVFDGQIYTSTDSGLSWTPRDTNRAWFSVASSADGTKLVAGALGGQIYTSIDSGFSWTPRDTNRDWVSVASSADGSKLVATAGGGQIYTSTDSGLNWTPRDTNRTWSSVTSSDDGVKLVAVVINGDIYLSTDSGVTWSTTLPGTTSGGSLTGRQLTAIELQYIGSGQFIILSHEGSFVAH